MRLKLINGFYIDGNNNRWDEKEFTLEDAERLSKTLVDCRYCTNCENCESCIYCENCKYCVDCKNCIDCIDCVGVKRSVNPNYKDRDMGTELDKVLADRRENYGSFSEVARVTELLENGLKEGKGWNELDIEAKQGMRFIVHKLARCVCGIPTRDSLVDVQGYAELILRHSNSVR